MVLLCTGACGSPRPTETISAPEIVGSPASPPSTASSAPASSESPLLSKVWRQTAPKDVPLGMMYVFLPGGSLLQTSCTEVYRLSTWRQERDRTLTIVEDTARYEAEFEPDGDRRVRLRFKLGGEWQPWKTLDVLEAPFVCPDLPR